MKFSEAADAYKQRLEAALDGRLPRADRQPGTLHQAMRYAALDGGKRMRALLVYATGQALETDPEALDGPAAAVEMVHAYSLVHDDLPAMDNDELRRGKATCHIAFGEDNAILAGDALLTQAFHVLSQDPTMTASPQQRLTMINQLAEASGTHGMIGGQAMDMAATGHRLNIAELESMHIHKTGALIRACVSLGCHAGHAAPAADDLDHLDHFAKCAGLAFQIHDDVLDELGDADEMGKAQGHDRAHDKATYPAIAGMAAARERARTLADEALATLEPLGERGEGLRWLAKQMIERGS